jgi:hypothetical protein
MSRTKKKFLYFFDRILPPELCFSWIDLDDELSVALGRARLASATAMGALVDKRSITPKEARLQLISDGLFNISMPEDLDESEFDILTSLAPANNFGAKRPGMLGTQVPPSMGGQGEIKSVFEDEIDVALDRMLESLESGQDKFTFLPDVNGIADEWSYLVEDAQKEDLRSKISAYVQTTVPDRLDQVYGDALDKLGSKELNDAVADIGQEMANLRYNLVEDFSKEVIKIVKGNKDGKTKKTITRRRFRNNE